MKKIQLFSAVFFLMAALVSTSGCEPGTNANAEKDRLDSIRRADSLTAIARLDSARIADSLALVAAEKARMDSIATDSTIASDGEKSPDPAPQSSKVKNCYLKVSFISIGSGIDSKAVKQLLTEISTFEKAENVRLTFDKKAWGREGEIDYCFSSLGLTDPQRDKWTKRVKKAFQGNELVQFPA
jgi:hypothetical protein